MHAFTIHDGLVVPLERAHVNTDDIIPARYLTSIERIGFADGLFTNWRYLSESGQPDPAFPLNQPRYQGASILLTRENFGCGSSREHAPWALFEYGFRAIIAPNFADIFYNNCLNTGLLPIPLETDQVQALFAECEATEGYILHIDLEQQIVQTSGGRSLHFPIDAFRKASLLQGLDAIGRTLQQQDRILAYENRRKQETPWYYDA
jgi:3-isopropylmalate/(R)-2-methylmalate dehydratase small subunit